jgi:elongation factor G
VVSTDRIRNVVLVGHNGNGKTSLAEALLYRAGVVARLGRVDQGTTVLDWQAEARERRQTLSLATTSFQWNDHKINLIDTPGYADFIGDALMGLRVADLAVFVIDGVAGVHPQDRVLWGHAEEFGIPRLFFINKLDRDHSSFARTLDQVRSIFGSHADPVELPIGEESNFHGIADLLTDHAFLYDSGRAEEAPTRVDSEQAEQHEHLIEDVIEADDELLEQYLDGSEPSSEQLDHLLHEAMDAGTVFPVLCGSATAPIGADYLADFICRVGPGPGDAGPTVVGAAGTTIEIAPDANGQPLAFVFKTTVDDFLGKVSLFKTLSGTIGVDDTLVNSRSRTSERLHQLASLSGANHTWVSEVVAGDIGAATKLEATQTGDTLAPSGTPVVFQPPTLPKATYGVGIRAAKITDDERLTALVDRLIVEDPTLRLDDNAVTHQKILSGGGETHIQVALSQIARLGVQVDVEDIRIAHRETLAGAIEIEGRHRSQGGSHGQVVIALVRFEPLAVGSGFEFESEVHRGDTPRNVVAAIGAGIEEAMASGGRYGYPLVDIRAVCLDGKHLSADASELSFKMAGVAALTEAVERVGVNVLEPVSEIWVSVPSGQQGDVLGDLIARRAQVLGVEESDANESATVHAYVPTAEITRYAADLRSMTAGIGSFEFEEHGYQVLADGLVENVRPV